VRIAVRTFDAGSLSAEIAGGDRALSLQEDSEGEEEFAAETSVAAFCGQVKSAMQVLLDEHGASGYEERWRYPFPEHAYAELAALLRARRTHKRQP